MRSRVTVLGSCVCVCMCVYYQPSGNSFHSLTQTEVIHQDFLDFNSRICFVQEIWRYLLILARLDIFRRQKTQQMLLTSSPASTLSDDIGNRGHISQNKRLSSLWLFGFYARTVSECTWSARDSHRARRPLNNCTMVCNCSGIFVSCSQHWQRVCTLALIHHK